MKMTPDDFEKFRKALFDTLKANSLHPFMVASMRHAWQVVGKATGDGVLDLNHLYTYLNDDHIDTALIKVFENLKSSAKHRPTQLRNLPSVQSAALAAFQTLRADQ